MEPAFEATGATPAGPRVVTRGSLGRDGA